MDRHLPSVATGALALGAGGLMSFLLARLFGIVAPPPREDSIVTTLTTLPSTKKDFTTGLYNALGQALPDASGATKVLIVAHGAYESAWGKGTAAKVGFNYWNLTDGQEVGGQQRRVWRWKGPVIVGNDTEYVPGTAGPGAIKQLFCKYSSPVEACSDYYKFLGASRYVDARAKLMAGDATFVRDLGVNELVNGVVQRVSPQGKGGFYTLPISKYVAGFNARLAEVRSLLG